MNFVKKNRIRAILLLLMLLPSLSFSGLNWMPSNYWFAGYMYIAGPDNLTYNLYAWNNTTKRMELSPITFNTNTVLNVRDLFGGNLDNCPYMWWGGDLNTATRFLLVPNKSYIPDVSQSAADQLKKGQQFEKDLRAGRDYPYIVVERNQGIINIFIVGPTRFSPSLSRKLGFNFLAFEQVWVKPSYWYNHLENHSPGMAFAFSFDANNGTFLNSPYKDLSNDSFYIFGLGEKNWPLGWSWTYQGHENTSVPINKVHYQYIDKNNKVSTIELGTDERCDDGGPVQQNKSCKICNPKGSSNCLIYKPVGFESNGMTAQKLISQGIIEYQQPVVSLRELQRIIDFINSTGQGKFDNVL